MSLGRLAALLPGLTPALRPLYVPCRHAGHSKWANIRHIKAAKDQERSKKFDRLAKLMRTAVAEAGPDPLTNLRLENLIDQARGVNMPNATIQSILKAGAKGRENARPGEVELCGPGNSSLVVELFTDNVRRSVNDITAFLRKHRGRLGPAKHAFTRCGVVVTAPGPGDLDAVTEHAIEAGAEDVEEQDGEDPGEKVLVFHTSWDDVYAVKKALTQRGYTVKHAETLYEPLTPVTLTGEDATLHESLLDKLNELNDVVKVSTNAEVES
ncbi:probable transcriptional regulatory protein Nmul_A2722 isoform X2 [Amphibalanus amphitrite]|nr:probable transcriptional regulatory protein Nmul_A2722 isoform X2 [Amphibalanus amphitrite]XP_043234752.1 probable transcriptional regulatory protein Nmul_A2722 isoform X2 [Amphibalanus amphitrite]XP_043234753.1 probable transcriptional regulatory protein Nmul_A2722 isoform X2 [Amphibalanus amphitrite]